MHSNDARTHIKNNRLAGKLGSRRGFTMAEMMMTVAILIILMGVLFVALLTYQRNLAFKERNAIAQEIFVAAQNHLTMTKGEGYLQAADNSDDVSKIGTPEIKAGSTTGEKSGVYYFIVNNGSGFTTDESTMLDRMLPFGSIDETVRKGGSYIVRYQPKTATVLDVFYFSTSGSPDRFNHTISTTNDTEYKHIIGLIGDNHKDDRRTYTYGGSKAVLGWYGGEDLEPLGFPLEAPQIELVNGDRLIVNIHNSNFNKVTADNGVTLKLLVTGLTSNAKMSILIDSANDDPRLDKNSNFTNNNCSFVLDDVTHGNMHFAELIDSSHYTYKGSSVGYLGNLIPGEDIKVEAVAYSATKLARIRFSKAEQENSLYDSISLFKTDTTGTSPNRIAYTSSLRHIENLDPDVSGIVGNAVSSSKLCFTEARQTKDIAWDNDVFNSNADIYLKGSATPVADYYYPSNPRTLNMYNGLKHSVKDLKVDYGGPSGLFGMPADNTSISNLELIDFDVKATGGSATNNAGALAGTLNGAETIVSNVVARNTKTFDESKWNSNKFTATIVSSGGSAGGLIGAVSGGQIEYCGAALNVTGNTNAGGLIGRSSGTRLVEGCFSGGHTKNGEYYNDGDREEPLFNIAAGSKGTAGGLIGNAGRTSIQDSYSTCSVTGNDKKSGGFVGEASGEINNCYCTGLVCGTRDNAFIGSGTISGKGTSYYYEITSEYYEDFEIEGNKVVGYKEPGSSKVKAMDSSATVLGSTHSGYGKDAVYYDNYLGIHYPNGSKDNMAKYEFRTVTQLKSDIPNENKLFVNRHYGDWPSPEIFIINN